MRPFAIGPGPDRAQPRASPASAPGAIDRKAGARAAHSATVPATSAIGGVEGSAATGDRSEDRRPRAPTALGEAASSGHEPVRAIPPQPAGRAGAAPGGDRSAERAEARILDHAESRRLGGEIGATGEGDGARADDGGGWRVLVDGGWQGRSGAG